MKDIITKEFDTRSIINKYLLSVGLCLFFIIITILSQGNAFTYAFSYCALLDVRCKPKRNVETNTTNGLDVQKSISKQRRVYKYSSQAAV